MAKYLDDNGLLYLWQKIKAVIPTNNSQLTNGAGYQTAANVESIVTGKGYQTAAQVQSAINTSISSVYKYKGSKATVAELPTTGNAVGDVWNVTATGMNYVWTGSAWDALGSELSVEAITNAEIDTIVAS